MSLCLCVSSVASKAACGTLARSAVTEDVERVSSTWAWATGDYQGEGASQAIAGRVDSEEWRGAWVEEGYTLEAEEETIFIVTIVTTTHLEQSDHQIPEPP